MFSYQIDQIMNFYSWFKFILVRLAINLWQNNTCLTFNELTAITSNINRTYILFTRDDEYGCSSPVGYDRTDPTSMILLASGCGDVRACSTRKN